MTTLGLSVNLSRAGATQISGMDFTSLVFAGDRVLAANSSGLFEIGGDDDDGEEIDAHVTLPETDFGFRNNKMIRCIDFGIEADGAVGVTIENDGMNSREYVLDQDILDRSPANARLAVGSDGLGRYFKITVSNVDGSKFELDTVDVSIVVRGGR